MQQPRFGRALGAGIIGLMAFTMMLYAAPYMGVPKMEVPALLGGMFGINSLAVGWMMHVMIGIVLALIYAYGFVDRAAGAGWLRGLKFGILPWFVMMIVVAPMLPLVNPTAAKMPPGIFLANLGMMAAIGSLVAHLVWGIVVGAVYGAPSIGHESVLRPQG